MSQSYTQNMNGWKIEVLTQILSTSESEVMRLMSQELCKKYDIDLKVFSPMNFEAP